MTPESITQEELLELRNLDLRAANLRLQDMVLGRERTDYQERMLAKYGEVQVNMDTGGITRPAKPVLASVPEDKPEAAERA